MNEHPWPRIPSVDEESDRGLIQALFEAQLTDCLNRRNAGYAAAETRAARDKALWDEMVAAEDRMREAVHAAYLDVAKATLERSLKRAELQLAVTAGLASIYIGVLGLTYANTASKVDLYAVLPAAMFAFSIALSSYYASFLTRRARTSLFLPAATSTRVQHRRLADFVDWVNGTALDRKWALRGSVLCIFFATFTMPAAFLTEYQSLLVGVAALVTALAYVVGRRLDEGFRH